MSATRDFLLFRSRWRQILQILTREKTFVRTYFLALSRPLRNSNGWPPLQHELELWDSELREILFVSNRDTFSRYSSLYSGIGQNPAFANRLSWGCCTNRSLSIGKKKKKISDGRETLLAQLKQTIASVCRAVPGTRQFEKIVIILRNCIWRRKASETAFELFSNNASYRLATRKLLLFFEWTVQRRVPLFTSSYYRYKSRRSIFYILVLAFYSPPAGSGHMSTSRCWWMH